MDKRQRIEHYTHAYSNDYDFEKILVKYRKLFIGDLIYKKRPRRVLEIGCGKDPLFKSFLDMDFWERWVTIEPSPDFSNEAKRYCDDRCYVVCDFFENVPDTFTKKEKFDMIICSALLHEVDNPEELLKKILSSTDNDTLVHINVPNAYSFHRQLAYEMGIIPSVFEMSERNISLSQYQVFDIGKLRTTLEEFGFKVVEDGGYFMKPFTHKQMQKILEEFGSEKLLDGLYRLGIKYPELASEIFCNVKRNTI